MAAILFMTISVPVDGGQRYYSLNIATHTAIEILNGTQLDFYRALGIPEHTNQSAAILDGYTIIGADQQQSG